MILTSIFDTKQALFDSARKLLANVNLSMGDAPAAVLIPGGATPKPFFDMTAGDPFILHPQLYFGFTDERHVPPEDPRSNYGMAAPMLDALQAPASRVIRVPVELPLEAAATAYHDAWQAFLGRSGTIRLVFLGIGEDGHTCSLFTTDQVRSIPQDRYATSVERTPGPNRITTTPVLLSKAAHVVFLVTGRSKAQVVDAMIEPFSPMVAAQAVAHCARVSLWYAPVG